MNYQTSDMLDPEALATLKSEAEAFIEVLRDFVQSVAETTDLDDVEQTIRRERQSAALQSSLGRLNDAELDYTGEMSFFPSDSEGLDEAEEIEDQPGDSLGSTGAGEGVGFTMLARFDLRAYDMPSLLERGRNALIESEGASRDSARRQVVTPLDAVQQLLPEVGYGVEALLETVLECEWMYVCVGEEGDRSSIFGSLPDEERREFKAVYEDDGH